MLQDWNSSEFVKSFDNVQSVATDQPELQLAETLSDLHHARQLIDNLSAQLGESERTAAERYSTAILKLEYAERVCRAC